MAKRLISSTDLNLNRVYRRKRNKQVQIMKDTIPDLESIQYVCLRVGGGDVIIMIVI